MFKELLSKVFGKCSNNKCAQSVHVPPSDEQQAVARHLAISVNEAFSNKYIANQLQRRPNLEQMQKDMFSQNENMCESNVDTMRTAIAAAEDPSTTPDVLEQLAQHDLAEVRIAVSDNPMVSLNLLGALVRDENPDVRFALAENHQMPVQLLEVLADDDNPYIGHRARRTLTRINNSGILHHQFPYRGDAWWATQLRAASSL